ncbi:hypothetical protein Bbelb_110570 [Branchiostoma belcheri]|nr:hypothetical protein Bbelb_110570 [Branchiostoma belcheri]
MSKRLHRHADCLRVLNKANPKLRKAILSSAPNDLLKGNIRLTPTQKKGLARYKSTLRQLGDNKPVTVRVLSSSTPTTKTTTDTDVKVSASPATPSASGKDEQDILDAFPKTMKSRARQILNVIKHKGGDVISYDDQGQLLFNKQVVPGSNVADLIRDALQMRRGFNPGLASINAPEAAIRNPMRLSVIHRHKSRAAKGEELSDEDDIPTRYTHPSTTSRS